MSHAYFNKKPNIFKKIKGEQISLVLFIGFIIVFVLGINSFSSTTSRQEEEALRAAIKRSIISCYCLEGTYPPSLDYIKENYGLRYDEDVFFVDYRAFGSNIMPDVTVNRREQNE